MVSYLQLSIYSIFGGGGKSPNYDKNYFKILNKHVVQRAIDHSTSVVLSVDGVVGVWAGGSNETFFFP